MNEDALEPPDFEHSWEVARAQRGLSLFDFLDAIAGPMDRKKTSIAMREQQVLLNGVPANLGQSVRVGDEVALTVAVETLRRKPRARLDVLHQSDTLIVAVKPPSMPFGHSRSGGASIEKTISDHLGEGVRPRFAHRLDKETSGLVVAAIGKTASAELQDAFNAGDARVEYLALVRGRLRDEQGEIDVPLARKRSRNNVILPDAEHGAPCRTRWSVAERLRGFTVLDVVPRGGRSHQVRAHLAAADMPVLCDALYHEDDRLMLSELKIDYRGKRGRPERPLLDRPALHAGRFVWDGIDITTPLPKDLRVTLEQLRRLRALEDGDPSEAAHAPEGAATPHGDGTVDDS